MAEKNTSLFSFNFKGKATRSDYWFVMIITGLIAALLSFIVINLTIFYSPILSIILIILICVPLGLIALACAVRRLHDLGLNGIWALLYLIPIVNTVFSLVIGIIPGKKSELAVENADPKHDYTEPTLGSVNSESSPRSSSPSTILEVIDLEVNYGSIQALHGINFSVNKGEIVTLIGANGAGKTSTLHSISKLIKPKSGQVLYEGLDLTKETPEAIVSRGLIQVPEGRRVFANLTVHDNLILGAYTRNDQEGIKRDLDKVFTLFPRLEERYKQISGTLSGGEQQMLAMGRALMSRPRVLLLDEPSMGLAPLIVKEIFRIIQEINKEGTTVLLVEQNAHMALQIAHHAYVLETGRVVQSGPAKELAASDEVRKAYLGG